MNIKPFGNRILVKIVESLSTDSGLSKPEGIEPEFSSWGEVIALPDHEVNPFINTLAVGDLVAFMHFAKDKVIDPKTAEECLMLETESETSKGQVVAVIKNREAE